MGAFKATIYPFKTLSEVLQIRVAPTTTSYENEKTTPLNKVKRKLTSVHGVQNAIDFGIEVAAKAHHGQFRKGTDTPYISHPYAVALLLSEAGCAEELIIAGILHDTVEDTALTLEFICKNFGRTIAEIVEGCSEPDRSLPWEQRKKHTVEFLKTAPIEVRTVACADKLHNLRTIIADYQVVGNDVWRRFSRGKEAQEWYYRELVPSLCAQSDCHEVATIFQQFRDAVEILFGKK